MVNSNALTRHEAIDMYHIFVLVGQNLEYQGMNSKGQNMYTTDISLSHKLYYAANNLFDKISTSDPTRPLIIVDDDHLEIGSFSVYEKANIIALLRTIILSVTNAVQFRGELFYGGWLNVSNSLLGDGAAVKSKLGAIIFD